MSKSGADQTQPGPQGYRAMRTGDVQDRPANARASSLLSNLRTTLVYGEKRDVQWGKLLTISFVKAHLTPARGVARKGTGLTVSLGFAAKRLSYVTLAARRSAPCVNAGVPAP